MCFAGHVVTAWRGTAGDIVIICHVLAVTQLPQVPRCGVSGMTVLCAFVAVSHCTAGQVEKTEFECC
jgi:hypothetical protein